MPSSVVVNVTLDESLLESGSVDTVEMVAVLAISIPAPMQLLT